MGLAEIQAMYDNLYSSRYNDLVKKKQQSLADLDSQETTTNNQYTDLFNNLNQKKTDTSNKYKQLYTGLDDKQAQGKVQYYNDRNNTAVNSAQKAQQIRDWMAKNNLLASGESVDAQLRNNTDYSNNMGNIDTNETNFNRDIMNSRNQYGAEEQGIYNDIGNQISSADREKTQKLNDILGKRSAINAGFEGDNSALKADIDAQRMKDINAYNAVLEQRAYEEKKLQEQRDYEAKQAELNFQRQQALQAAARAASARNSSGGRSGGSYSGRSGGSKNIGGIKADSSNSFYAAFADLVDNGGATGNVTTGNGVAKQILQNNKNDIVKQYGQSFYNKLLSYQFNNQPAWMRTDSGRAAAQTSNSYNTVSGTRMGGYAD